MGYLTSAPILADIDADGDIDGILTRIRDGTGITVSLSNNVLTIDTSGGVVQFYDGVPDSGENNDIGIDYTNGDVYKKASNTWTLVDSIPSFQRLRMFTGTYVTSSWAAGKFGISSGKYYFYKTLFPGCSTVANAETYLTNNGYRPGTRFIFQQVDNKDNVAVFRATTGTIHTNGDAGYDDSGTGTENVGLELTSEYGVSLSATKKYHVYITIPVNFLFDATGNVTTDGSMSIKEFILTTALGSTSSTTATTIDSWSTTTYRSAKYEYQITNTGADPDEYHIGEIMVVHDGSNAKYTDYGVIFTGSNPLGTFSTDVSSGNCRLRFTATNSNAMTVKVARKAMKV